MSDKPPFRVLYVEDNDLNYRVVWRAFRRTAIDLVQAKSAAEALSTARSAWDSGRSFQAVLLDVRLPDCDKPEFEHKLARPMRAIVGVKTPMLAVTAHAGMGDEQELVLNAGCDDYIAKPITEPKGLVDKVVDLYLKKNPRLSTAVRHQILASR